MALRESKELASHVIGYEVAITKILDKYNMPVSDQNRIIDYLALIERTTVKTYVERQKELRYVEKIKAKDIRNISR